MSLPVNQCPGCLRHFKNEGYRRSHQTQTGCKKAPANVDEVMSDPAAPTSPSSVTTNPHQQHTFIEIDSPPPGPPIYHPAIPSDARSDHGGASSLFGNSQGTSVGNDPNTAEEVEMESVRKSIPSAVATTEEELADQIRKMLGEMIHERTKGVEGGNTSPKSSNHSGVGETSSAGRQNQFVTMRRLPENVDQAIAEFITQIFGQTNDADEDEQETTGEVFGDNRSDISDNQSDEEHFYTAVNASAEDLVSPIPPVPSNLPTDTIIHDSTAPGAPLRPCLLSLDAIHQQRVAAGQAPAWPFADYLEFEFVKWMVDNDISQTARDKLIKLPIISERCGLSFPSNYALNKLLDQLPAAGPRWQRIVKTITGTIPSHKPGEMLTEQVEFWVRDIIEVVRELIGNSAYGKKLVFAPCRVYINGDQSQRKIDEMWTANWWWRVQHKDEIPPGATIIPIILSSDATQLTNFSGGKSAWPVYITIGNIPKAIRAKINSYSTLLLAYLPVAKLECFPEKDRGDEKARLFHECMQTILAPLHDAGKTGLDMDCGDGFVRHCFPILAAYIADNPEQTMIACCRRNLCHRCTVSRDSRGDYPDPPALPRNPKHTADALSARDYGHTSSLFSDQGLKQFGTPFWDGLPHANIFVSLTPDILHQLHKGVFKEHLMNWCIDLLKSLGISADNIDYRYKLMPRHSNLRHFLSGVTKLKQSTANEHKEMQKVFIAVMAGLVPDDVLPVIIAAIDFIYYAQLPAHTSGTLDLLHDALKRFHEHKDVFLEYKIRSDFNINKVHSMSHYFESIWELGTADGYNTETPERLHIEFAKRAYKATNRRQFFEQMTIYLRRREQVAKFDCFLRSIIPEYAERVGSLGSDFEDQPSAAGWKLAKKSPLPPLPIGQIENTYGIRWFSWCLNECLAKHFPRVTIKPSLYDCFETFPKAAQIINDAFVSGQPDIIHASPLRGGSSRSKFDTVLIRKGDAASPALLNQPSYGMASHRIGRIRLIFKLPAVYGVDTPLAYIQVFKGPHQPATGPLKRVNMYRIERSRYNAEYQHEYDEEIIPLNLIRRSCHLLPIFGGDEIAVDGSELGPDSLEMFDEFYLNTYFDLHTFQFL